MEYRVVILSKDTLFAQMLEIEFSMQGISCKSTPVWDADDIATVVLLDLDTAVPPPGGSYEQLMGFTKNQSLYSADQYRQCSMILHRPFEVRLLRREVLACLRINATLEEMTREMHPRQKGHRPTLNEEADLLFHEEKEIPLTPSEGRIMTLLLENRGRAVSSKILADVIGEKGDKALAVYICYLRRKTDSPDGTHLIRTVRGEGYRID